MQRKEVTSIYYHVPEDHDNAEQPNYFSIPIAKNRITLEHIFEFFPLKGTYIFRFKFAFEGFVVWLDINELSARLPTYRDNIVVKAHRISWEDCKLNLAKTERDTFKIAQIKQVKKESVNLFDHHETDTLKYSSTQSAKLIHEDILGTAGGSRGSGGHGNLLEGFHGTGQSASSFNFLEQKTEKKWEQLNANVGNFSKHSDLI